MPSQRMLCLTSLWIRSLSERRVFSFRRSTGASSSAPHVLCVCADVKATVRLAARMRKCLLPKPPRESYMSFICEEGLQHFGAHNPFSVLKHTHAPPRVDSLSRGLNSEPAGSPSFVRANHRSTSPKQLDPHPPPRACGGDGARCFYGAIRLVCLSQILFLRLAYTFLLQMVYIPRQGAVLNQLAAPCSWDQVETLSSARLTGD